MTNGINNRRKTNAVYIGQVPMGSDFPIRVQSMANTLTSDLEGSVAQCIRIADAGADYVRFTVPSLQDADAISRIRKMLRAAGYQTPIIADVHFNAGIAMKVAGEVEKVRINPGNFTPGSGDEISESDEASGRALQEIRNRLVPLIDACRRHKVALRIGVNHGSLSRRIMNRYGDTPAGMAESAMEYLRICKEEDFDQVVVSMKASNIRVMVYATRLVVRMMDGEGMNFLVHLGVTEAGEGEDGRIKSAAGIGSLLNDGIGDTIRISLTEDPEKEIPVALKLIRHISKTDAPETLPESMDPLPDQFSFTRRASCITGNMGGNHVPVVIGECGNADYLFRDAFGETNTFPAGTQLIVPYREWLKGNTDTGFPLFTPQQFLESNRLSAKINFVLLKYSDRDVFEKVCLRQDSPIVLVYEGSKANIQAELRWFFSRLMRYNCPYPVIIRLQYKEDDLESLQVKSASDAGGTFIDGFGDGLWIINCGALPGESSVSTAFGILQNCRSRITRTEYISCPSCGRTNFNLIETLTRIRMATSHIKNLKIGVMGCIVNGPGEMADADYGYVGAGRGKITLYKSKQVVKKGIPELSAVDELIALIKENGDWVDP